MRYEEMLEHVRDRAGLDTREQAEGAVRAVSQVLAQRLPAIVVRHVADQVPAPVGQWLRDGDEPQDFDLHEFYRQVGEYEAIRTGFAVEHSQVVCQVLGEQLDHEGHAHLEKHLPAEFVELFRPREVPPAPAHEHTAHGHHHSPYAEHTLAGGRPGGRHPLSEGDDSAGAHTHSVSHSHNPHGRTKISSSPGVSSERQEHTLSTGRSGSEHPLSGDDEELEPESNGGS
jgi:uncharacterized protein (DUF2267 family)